MPQAMAAGVTSRVWITRNLIELALGEMNELPIYGFKRAIRALWRLLKDVPALVRDFTGCERRLTDQGAAHV